MVEASRAQSDGALARTRLGVRDVLVAEDLGPAVLVNANGLHEAESSS